MANTFQDIFHLPPRKPRKLVAGFCRSLKAWEPWDQLQISGQDCKSENLEVNGRDWYTIQNLKARQAEVLGSKAGADENEWPILWREGSTLYLLEGSIQALSWSESHHSLVDGGSSLSVHRLKGQSPPYSYPETTIRISHNPGRLIPKIKHHSIQYHVKHG